MGGDDSGVTTVKPKPRQKDLVQLLPPYHVIILNDDLHSFEFVIEVIRKVFGYPIEKAFELTKEAHTKGRAVVWTGPKEVAELKAEQVHTFHEVRAPEGRQLGPLGCVIEPAPGG